MLAILCCRCCACTSSSNREFPLFPPASLVLLAATASSSALSPTLAAGHGPREDALIKSGRVPKGLSTSFWAIEGPGSCDRIDARGPRRIRGVILGDGKTQEAGDRYSEWKTLYSARHLDEVELNSQANRIVEQSMRELSAFRSAVAEQRQLQEAKLEQRLLVRRAQMKMKCKR